MYHIFDARNAQYDDFKSMIKDDKYPDKTKKVFHAKLIFIKLHLFCIEIELSSMFIVF